MEAILRVALSNTLLAAMLALAALAVSRIFRRPALSHALWLIVLLKLITPPLWNVALPLLPVEKTHKPPLPPTELSMPPAEPLPQIDLVQADDSQRLAMPTLEAPEISEGWHGQRYSDARAVSHDTRHGHASTPAHATQLTFSQSLPSAWIAGSAFCILIIALRVRQFTRLLRFAEPADAHVQMLARALSSRVGSKCSPRVWFVPGPLCPMLWAFGGKARLLIPAGLWERLEDSQRSTLLLHELAHYRRGDHWIRALELLITVLFWWNPIAWWARHELREAEEQCCDAWVIWTLPRAARDYAIALMEAIDFVSTTRCAVPVLASPMGEFHDLKRRLLMIKQHAAPKALGWRGFSLMCALAAILLPLSGTLAQQATAPPAGLPPTGPAPELPPATTAAPAVGAATGVIGDIAVVAAVTDADPNAAAQREAQALVEELQKTSDEIARLTERLHQAQTRLTEIQRTTQRVNVGMAPPTAETRAGANPLVRQRLRTNNGFGGGYPGMGDAAGTQQTQQNNLDQERRLRAVEQKLDRLIEIMQLNREERKEHPDQPEAPAPRGRGYFELQKR